MDKLDRLRQAVPLLLDWYEGIKRELPWRENKDPYRIWVSEIMLQQTRVDTVIPYYKRFMETLPTVKSLAQCEEEPLLKLWEGLGYYSRVRNLQQAALQVLEEYGGMIPQSYEALRRLKGVGEYTAGAIASIAFDLPVAAVDGNVLRVLSRLLLWEEDVLSAGAKKQAKVWLEEVIPPNSGDFNQSVMELGALVCQPGTGFRCEVCPLHSLCEAEKERMQAQLPYKAEKKSRRLEERTLFLLYREGKIALRRRPKQGLLGGMWELPSAEGLIGPVQGKKLLEQWQLQPGEIFSLSPSKHVFSHVQWNMQAFKVHCKEEGEGFFWAGREELEQKVALPSAFKPYLQAINEVVHPVGESST